MMGVGPLEITEGAPGTAAPLPLELLPDPEVAPKVFTVIGLFEETGVGGVTRPPLRARPLEGAPTVPLLGLLSVGEPEATGRAEAVGRSGATPGVTAGIGSGTGGLAGTMMPPFR